MSSYRVGTSPSSPAAARPCIAGPRSPPGSRRDRRRTSNGGPAERPAALRPLEEAGGGRDSSLAQDGRAGTVAGPSGLLAALHGPGHAGLVQGHDPGAALARPHVAMEAVPRSVDRRVVQGARASHGHRELCPGHGPAARGLPQSGGTRQEGRRAAHRGDAGRAGRALAQPGGGNREADHRPRGEDLRRGRSHRRDAQTAGGADRRRSKGPRVTGVTIESIQVGDIAQLTRRVADRDIAEFVDAVGDYNPVHSDRDYAASTMFKEPIAPGIWTAGLISAVIGTRLPGPGAIYLSQDLKFLKPVKFNDVITARVEVLETNRERNRVRLKTVCSNQRGEEVLAGEALVMPSRTRVDYEATSRQAMGALALWMLAPWAWAAQGAAVVGMLGLAALGLSSPDREV